MPTYLRFSKPHGLLAAHNRLTQTAEYLHRGGAEDAEKAQRKRKAKKALLYFSANLCALRVSALKVFLDRLLCAANGRSARTAILEL